VSEDAHLWSETYDGSLDDIFKIQDEITGKITEAMKLQFASGFLVSSADALTSNAEAYQLYLQGRHFWRQRNASSLHRAVGLFSRAVELDPKFHQAWSNLAVAYLNLPDYDRNSDTDDSIRKGLEAADRALDLNPGSTEARIIRANTLEFQCQVAEGARQYEAAIANDPDDPTARHWYAMVLIAAGRLDYALEQIETARRLDPLITAVMVVNALALNSLNQTDQAIALVRDAASMGFRGGAADWEGMISIMAGQPKKGAELMRQASARETDPERKRVMELVADAAEEPAKIGALEDFLGHAGNFHPYSAAEYADWLAALGSPFYFTYLEDVDCPILGQNLWTDAFRAQRGTPEFFELMKRTGYVDLWREYGWPDDCASLDQSLAECPE
jgi:tetratricopeptide (TPR) repeat protein